MSGGVGPAAENRVAVLLDHGGDAGLSAAREGTALSHALGTRGFEVARFGDAREALAALAQRAGDLLIVDADVPGMDLRGVVESVRADPRTAMTLMVALVGGDPRQIPARREMALVLAKPLNVDDAASRLEGLVNARQRAVAGTRDLRGSLSQIALPDILQLLTISHATGTLTVESGGRRGALVLAGGEVQHVGFGPAAGLKAFVRMLQASTGTFSFTQTVADGGAGASGEVMPLGPMLFEATRQIDELARFRETLPPAWTELRRARGELPPELAEKVSRGETAYVDVARLLDAPRTLGALLDASPATDAELLEALDAFRGAGLVEFTGNPSGERFPVLDAVVSAALVARLSEHRRRVARVLLVLDATAGVTASQVLRVLSGLAGFSPSDLVMTSPMPLGPLGTLSSGEARVEVFAVPCEPELFPLWAAFGAGADAAVLAAPRRGEGASREELVLSNELGLPLASVSPPLSSRSLADALRTALERLIPRR